MSFDSLLTRTFELVEGGTWQATRLAHPTALNGSRMVADALRWGSMAPSGQLLPLTDRRNRVTHRLIGPNGVLADRYTMWQAAPAARLV